MAQATRQVRPPKTGTWVLLVVAVIVLGVAAFGFYMKSRTAAKRSGTVGARTKSMLCLAGANTIGAKLAPSLAEAFLKQIGATEVKVVPGSASGVATVQGILPGTTSPSVIEIDGRANWVAFDRLADGSCDIGMSARRINQEEITKLPFMGDMTSPSNEHVLALDGIAILVNKNNPVVALTKEQVAGIFSGAITDWSQVSSIKGSIVLYAPFANSATEDGFRSLVLGGAPVASTIKRGKDMASVSASVAADPMGVGFVGSGFMGNAKAVAVSERGTTALLPRRMTIATEDYPLARRMYLYTPAHPANQYVASFLEFMQSRVGQDLVGAAGFIPQNVVADDRAATAQSAPPEYNRLTRGAGRLSLDFRFLPGGAVLDDKAITDINRVVDFVGDMGYGGNNILLFGFADSTGNPQTNLQLSEMRARAVADQFVQRGLKPGLVRGFGGYLPVASNDTAEGRQKNRRVEIWLRK
ncbi:MAG: phosphate ABC transporter substrate-binding/OmpA family protein [Terriglobales bacterium]